MNNYLKLICFLIILSSFGCINQNNTLFTKGKWIDLTHDFSDETIYWPTAEGFKLKTDYEGVTEKGYFYSAYSYCSAEHGGTHIDAPIHFYEGRNTLDQIPVSQLIGDAIVIDVSETALADPDYQVGVTDFENWEAANGKIPDASIVLLRTGYGKFWPDRVKYMGTDERGSDAVKKLHFPGLDPDAARWIVANRKINAIGLDTPSIDYGQSQLFESHRVLFKHNIPAFENVANLDKLPGKGAFVIALPMKIKGGSGGPLRIIAYLP
ncbi:MAG: cyclase family protein [Thermodesulfobacteriota bacterium]